MSKPLILYRSDMTALEVHEMIEADKEHMAALATMFTEEEAKQIDRAAEKELRAFGRCKKKWGKRIDARDMVSTDVLKMFEEFGPLWNAFRNAVYAETERVGRANYSEWRDAAAEIDGVHT